MILTPDNILLDIIGLGVAILVITITFLKWKFSYWNRVNLPSLNPEIPFGDAKDLFTGKLSIGEQFQDFYNKFRAKGLKHGGIYMGLKPFYIPVDTDIIKHIMQKDFQHFLNHGLYINEEVDPLSGHLFNLEGAKWRNMRTKLTPTFTSGKIKMMFQTVADCTVGLKTIMDESASDHSPVDIKDILGRFTTDIIGSVAFGLECNSLKDPEALFRKYGKKIFEASFLDRIKTFLVFGVPHNILRMFNFKVTKSDVEKFFMKAIHDTVSYREKNNVYRKDFMHLLLQLKNRGTVNDDKKITDGEIGEKALTMNQLAAQAFVFFKAGFETSSTTMTWALYELATNPDIQNNLRNEINEVLKKHDGKLTYDSVMEMVYMDKVIYETLRKYPPVPFLPRKCNKEYTIPNTDVRIEKDIDVAISALGIHMDPEYYPNPAVFDPERFSEENKQSRPAFSWLPFGEGPRICIGIRFGMLQSKVGLTTLLKNYKITLSRKTELPLVLDKKSFITTAQGGVWIDVQKIYLN